MGPHLVCVACTHIACSVVLCCWAEWNGTAWLWPAQVLKPGVEDVLTTDMSYVYLFSKFMEFIQPELARLSLTGGARCLLMPAACLPAGNPWPGGGDGATSAHPTGMPCCAQPSWVTCARP